MNKSIQKGVQSSRKKKKPPVYDEVFKAMVVRECLELQNVKRTASKYGIARGTLLSWMQQLSETNIYVHNERVTTKTIEAIEKTSDAVVRSIERAAATREEFIKEHYADLSDAFRYNIKAITDRLRDNPQGIPFRDLASCLTAITGMVKEFLPVEEQSTTQINLLQQTINNN